jgi:CYTH domain-containing protein
MGHFGTYYKMIDNEHIKNRILKNMKDIEIERKFLVRDKSKIPDISKYNYQDITQCYLPSVNDNLNIRMRQILYMSSDCNLIGEEYLMTIKGNDTKIRTEREIILWRNQYHELWPDFKNLTIHKHRYELKPELKYKYKKIDFDIYKHELNGLYIVEVEFENLTDCNDFIPESWYEYEVTNNKEFSNYNLASRQKIPQL